MIICGILGASYCIFKAVKNNYLNDQERIEYKDTLLKKALSSLENHNGPYIYTHKLKSKTIFNDPEYFNQLKIIDMVPVTKSRETLRIGNLVSIKENYKTYVPNLLFSSYMTNIPQLYIGDFKGFLSNTLYPEKTTKHQVREGIEYVSKKYNFNASFYNFKGKQMKIKESQPLSEIALYGTYNGKKFEVMYASENEYVLSRELANQFEGSHYVVPYVAGGIVSASLIAYILLDR